LAEQGDAPRVETTLERAQRIRDYVERMIAELGEHPECELKREWRRDTSYLRAEFIKDIQSIANSEIPREREKYIVVGADEQTRTITGCNHADFDEAGIRQLLESNLDPVPEFEVLGLTSSAGVNFVVIRIPHQPNRPFVANATIRVNDRVYLAEGQIWIKPGGGDTGSTQKRLVTTRAELLQLINIEPLVQREVAARVEQLLPQIRLEERTRLQGQAVNFVSALTATDAEFEAYAEQVLAAENERQLSMVIEKLRERTVTVWALEPEESRQIPRERVVEIKETTFIPAMRRIVHLGLILIRYSAPIHWFERLASLLVEIYNSSNSLGRVLVRIDHEASVDSLANHSNHTVLAVESLLAAYLLAGYELSRRDDVIYAGTLFPHVVKSVPPPFEEWQRDGFYLFWPITHYGFPNRQRELLVLERYGSGDRIEELVGGKKAMRRAVLEIDCLIDWHSFMSQRSWGSGQAGEPEVVEYVRNTFPNVSTVFHPNFTHEPLNNVIPLIERLWTAIHTGNKNFYLLDAGWARAFAAIDLERREQLLARFLTYAESKHSEWMWTTRRFPHDVWWPPQIRDIVNRLKQ